MDSSESQPFSSFKAKKILNKKSKPASSSSSMSAQTLATPPADQNPWNSKTPEKPTPMPRRVRKATDRKGIGKQRQIASRLSESPVVESKNADGGGPIKLPEKYEMLATFFNSLDCSIRLLQLKGSTSSFSNICPKVEALTNRRFSHSHLAQLKFILPEAIAIKKILTLDERTSCMKPDLHVTLKAHAVECDGKMKFGSGNLHMRKVFCSRLLDFFNAHLEGDEIPEETLPEPFSQSKHDLHSNTIKASNSPLPIETSTDALLEQQPVVASHFSPNFQRHFSQKVSNHEEENTRQKPSEDSLQPIVLPVPELCLNKSFSNKEAIACAAPLPIKFSSKTSTSETFEAVKISPSCVVSSRLPATPSKEINSSKNEKYSPIEISSIQGTPAKFTSTPAKLMTVTPALQSTKRCYMSPDDDSNRLPIKLARRTLCTRSLKFDNPVKNAKVEDEVKETGCSLINSGIFGILPENLLQSIREKERKAMEEQDPAISQVKSRQQIIASLPKLFNTIHFLFQSTKRSVITKGELIYKIIVNDCDVVDKREVEEQLVVLQELIPEWIFEKLAFSGDFLVCINKTSSPESIHARLAEAK
ncbi:hypothetical protein L1049_010879 [Liquidambar formosana]|uniref:CDT1 Geminin-binding domain-containing protein n=1 Tax=Liquidambar formosana TaxID=63359 RepID=A0AAP0RQ97_LIQFO